MLVVALSTLLAGILALGAATLAGTAHASRVTEPSSYPKPTIVPYPGAPAGDGDAYLDPARFHRLFAQDLPRSTTDLMGATQRPGALGALVTPQAPRRGRPSPSWYLVAKQDRIIPPEAERVMAARAHAKTVSINSSHVAMMSHPGVVVELIKAAAH